MPQSLCDAQGHPHDSPRGLHVCFKDPKSNLRQARRPSRKQWRMAPVLGPCHHGEDRSSCLLYLVLLSSGHRCPPMQSESAREGLYLLSLNQSISLWLKYFLMEKSNIDHQIHNLSSLLKLQKTWKLYLKINFLSHTYGTHLTCHLYRPYEHRLKSRRLHLERQAMARGLGPLWATWETQMVF